jgi:NADH-quinone oxidoreductase subunit C
LLETKDAVGEVSLTVRRESLLDVCRTLRDDFEYQQLMEIAGVDYPQRAERFEVVYHLLSLTRNHRIRVRVATDEDMPVPSVTSLWPVAGWLEREVFDLFGVIFDGNDDLRRILTDYGFRGFPFRKDFPLSGYVELRYSEEQKRVVYEPVRLAQDFRPFDFLSPWEAPPTSCPATRRRRRRPGLRLRSRPGRSRSDGRSSTPFALSLSKGLPFPPCGAEKERASTSSARTGGAARSPCFVPATVFA